MKAIVYERYGPPDVLELREVERPAPGAGEVLLEVRAASVNASDWELLTGRPAYARIWGLLRPKIGILGSDVAGRVAAVGSGVAHLQPGDEVFGDNFERWGGFAEYVCVPEAALLPKPAELSFEEAAALPQAAVVALQGLRDRGLGPGKRVLVNGAGGGSGTFALQLAASFGAELSGVDSADKLELMRSLGATRVVDYAREDFAASGERYDLILDFVASRSAFDCARALRRGGRYVAVGGSVPRILQILVLGPCFSLAAGRKLGVLGWKPNREDLAALLELVAAGEVRPVIDSSYPLSETAEALRRLGAGQVKGKVVVTIERP